MKTHLRYRSALTVLIGFIALGSVTAEDRALEDEITLRTLEPQTVLYTIHRGPYADLGQAFGKLYGLAGSEGLRPLGPAVSVHLNNPQQIKPRHWLTEIRIPVAETALSLAGALGPMTDVKTVPRARAAATVKPAGADSPEWMLKKLYRWIYQSGYVPVDAPLQRMVGDSQAHEYKQMTVEVMVPIAKAEDLAD
jgi:DNA gyrase inhibitor GyrI